MKVSLPDWWKQYTQAFCKTQPFTSMISITRARPPSPRGEIFGYFSLLNGVFDTTILTEHTLPANGMQRLVLVREVPGMLSFSLDDEEF